MSRRHPSKATFGSFPSKRATAIFVKTRLMQVRCGSSSPLCNVNTCAVTYKMTFLQLCGRQR